MVIGNGGLGNGIQRETILKIFSPYGKILDVVMKENRSYCFVSFCDTASAQTAFNELNGQCPADIQVQGFKFYIAFIDKCKFQWNENMATCTNIRH